MEDVEDIDFRDGNGPQPTRRHTNPDGSLGGWVAESATVEPGVQLHQDARVYGRARIESGAEVDGPAHISEQACVTGSGYMSGFSVIQGDARLEGTMFGYTVLAGDSFVAKRVKVMPLARIMSSGLIEDTSQYFHGWGGMFPGPWTVYRGKDSSVWLTVNFDAQPLEDWIAWCGRSDSEELSRLRPFAEEIRRGVDWARKLPVLRDW